MPKVKTIPADKIYDIAHSRFDVVKTLLSANHFDEAVYLCGYTMELILKRHICLNLGWDSYPPHYEGFKTFVDHDLNKLLTLSGLRVAIENDDDLQSYWATVQKWKVDWRYYEPDQQTEVTAKEIIDATRYMLNWVMKREV